MATIYRWRSGATIPVTLSITSIGADNSGVKSVVITPGTADSFASNNVTKTSGGAPTNTSYTGTITLKSVTTPISTSLGKADYTITKTKVTWNSGGSVENTTTQTISLCEPATTVSINAQNNTLWSNATSTTIPLTRSFTAASGGTPYGSSKGTVSFTSGDSSYVIVSDATAVVSTSARLATLTSKTINRSKEITITGTASKSDNPNANGTTATASTLSGSAKVTIKNATESIALSFNKTSTYIGGTLTGTVTSTPHANGSGSIVFSNELTYITSSSTSTATVSSSTKASNNTNINTFTITGAGGGMTTISVSSTAAKVGKDVSATKQITCSSLGALKTMYTYIGGAGSFTVAYDSISSSSNVSAATASLQSNAFSFSGVASGTNTVTMASGAKVELVCSSLGANKTVNLVSSANSGTSTTVSFSNDLVLSVTTNSYITYTSSSGNIAITAVAGKSGTSHIYMRSGAKITVNVAAATVDDSTVELNVGDKKTVTINANDSIKTATGNGTVFTYTTSSGSIAITAKAAGSGSITLNSGLIINVNVKDITVSIS